MSQSKSVFLSYTRPDDADAKKIASALHKRGWEVWLADERLLPGMNWQDEIEKALRQSDVIAVLMNPDSLSRPDAFFELGAAIGMGKHVVPIVPAEFNSFQMPGDTRYIKAIERRSPEETADELVASLVGA